MKTHYGICLFNCFHNIPKTIGKQFIIFWQIYFLSFIQYYFPNLKKNKNWGELFNILFVIFVEKQLCEIL